MKMLKRLLIFMLMILLSVVPCIISVQYVNAAATGLNKTNATVMVGKTLRLKVKGTKTTAVKWYSSDKSIASVKDGVVKGKTPGRVTIKAKVNKKVYKCKLTVRKPWEEGTEQLTLYSKQGFGIRNSEYGMTITRDFAQDLRDKNFFAYLDGKDITDIVKLTVADWSCFVATLPEELQDGDHTFVLHVDDYAEYSDSFTYKHSDNHSGCVILNNGKPWAFTKGKWSMMSLLPGTAGKENEIEVYIDDVKLTEIRGYSKGKLKVNGDGEVPLWISQELIPIEAGSTHHVRITCPGFADFDEDVTFKKFVKD